MCHFEDTAEFIRTALESKISEGQLQFSRGKKIQPSCDVCYIFPDTLFGGNWDKVALKVNAHHSSSYTAATVPFLFHENTSYPLVRKGCSEVVNSMHLHASIPKKEDSIHYTY